MNYIKQIFANDPLASMMRFIVFVIVIDALVILNYKMFFVGDISPQLANLLEKMIAYSIAGKAGQSFAENIGSRIGGQK
jgi:hypothetical protein